MKLLNSLGYTILILIFLLSCYLYLEAPDEYSLSYCTKCMLLFIMSSITMLANNIKKYNSLILFELLFVIAFGFTNYVYPVYMYDSMPSFSLFSYPFNERVMSRATSIATIGITAFNIGVYEKKNKIVKTSMSKKYRIYDVSYFELSLLILLLLKYLWECIPYLSGGVQHGGGAAFFMILAIFLIYKRLYNHNLFFSKTKSILLWSSIIIFVIINFLVGNRGEPLYIIMAFLICYHLCVKKIQTIKFSIFIILGVYLFYLIGEIRTSDSSNTSVIERTQQVKGPQYTYLYASHLIINNRSLYVLVDYADKNGFNYGETQQICIYSIVPFVQSFMIKIFNIRPENFASVNLTTYIEFGEDPSKAPLGLGTNLIGDIYLCFGLVGVAVIMFFIGIFIRSVMNRACVGDTWMMLLYCCIFIYSVYYTRAAFLMPLRSIVWTFIMYKLSIVKKRI